MVLISCVIVASHNRGDLLLRCLEAHYGSLEICIAVPGKAEDLLRQIREMIETCGY